MVETGFLVLRRPEPAEGSKVEWIRLERRENHELHQEQKECGETGNRIRGKLLEDGQKGCESKEAMILENDCLTNLNLNPNSFCAYRAYPLGQLLQRLSFLYFLQHFFFLPNSAQASSQRE